MDTEFYTGSTLLAEDEAPAPAPEQKELQYEQQENLQHPMIEHGVVDPPDPDGDLPVDAATFFDAWEPEDLKQYTFPPGLTEAFIAQASITGLTRQQARDVAQDYMLGHMHEIGFEKIGRMRGLNESQIRQLKNWAETWAASQ